MHLSSCCALKAPRMTGSALPKMLARDPRSRNALSSARALSRSTHHTHSVFSSLFHLSWRLKHPENVRRRYGEALTRVLFTNPRVFWAFSSRATRVPKDARDGSVEGDGQQIIQQCLQKRLLLFPSGFLFSSVRIFRGILCTHNLQDVSPGAQNAVSGKRAPFCPGRCTSICAG